MAATTFQCSHCGTLFTGGGGNRLYCATCESFVCCAHDAVAMSAVQNMANSIKTAFDGLSGAVSKVAESFNMFGAAAASASGALAAYQENPEEYELDLAVGSSGSEVTVAGSSWANGSFAQVTSAQPDGIRVTQLPVEVLAPKPTIAPAIADDAPRAIALDGLKADR